LLAGRATRPAKALIPEDGEALIKQLTAPCKTVIGRPDKRDHQLHAIRDALLLVRMTGVRSGEAVKLRWKYDKDDLHIRGTKTDASDRYIPIPDATRPKLEYRRFLVGEYVFATSTGEPLDGSNLLRWMSEHTVYIVHDLHYTYITRGAQAGFNPKVLQKEQLLDIF